MLCWHFILFLRRIVSIYRWSQLLQQITFRWNIMKIRPVYRFYDIQWGGVNLSSNVKLTFISLLVLLQTTFTFIFQLPNIAMISKSCVFTWIIHLLKLFMPNSFYLLLNKINWAYLQNWHLDLRTHKHFFFW